MAGLFFVAAAVGVFAVVGGIAEFFRYFWGW